MIKGASGRTLEPDQSNVSRHRGMNLVLRAHDNLHRPDVLGAVILKGMQGDHIVPVNADMQGRRLHVEDAVRSRQHP